MPVAAEAVSRQFTPLQHHGTIITRLRGAVSLTCHHRELQHNVFQFLQFHIHIPANHRAGLLPNPEIKAPTYLNGLVGSSVLGLLWVVQPRLPGIGSGIRPFQLHPGYSYR